MSAARFDLAGKTALVTGASRGIGLAIAEALAGAGADIVGVSSSIEPAGSEVQERVTRFGRRFYARRVDLGDRFAVAAFAEEAEVGMPPVDILVNNAGVIRRAPALEQRDELWDEVIDVDLTSQFLLARAFGAAMLAQGHGKILFTASVLSFQGGVNVASYAAAKSGVVGLVRALSNEWAGSGVNVNAIAPGYIRTEATVPLQTDVARSSAIEDRIPAGRWGTAADVAGAAVFLSSAAADYVTGIVLPVDGGWLGR